MKNVKYVLLLASVIPLGCHPVINTTPPATLAPGYSSPADQELGESLAAVNRFLTNETQVNYPKLTPDQKTQEKAPLNNLVQATNLANTAYTAFHNGTQTLAQAQAAISSAQNAQTALTTAKGVQ